MGGLSPESRRRAMRAVKSTDTTPELALRRGLHRRGFRYRLHAKRLPGKPDLVFPRWGAAIFVHGCFWHRHPGCPRATTPASNRSYWRPKFERNIARDARNQEALRKAGWRVLIVWECELKRTDLPATLERVEQWIRGEAREG